MRHIRKRDVDAALKPYVWDFSNKVLYDLCRKYPEHTKLEHVLAKILLIGRVYAAAIERRPRVKKRNDANDFYQSIVGPVMLKARIDRWFTALQSDRSPGSYTSVRIHKRLQDLFAEIADLKKRSLASKYLHFHFPKTFFLYDSRAAWALRKVVPRIIQTSEYSIKRAEVDPVYCSFVRRCVWLRDHVFDRYGVWLTPRQLDRLLLNITDNERIASARKTMTEPRSRFIGKASDLIIVKRADREQSNKKAEQARESTLKALLKNARGQARKAGMKKSDIAAAIRNVRKRS